MIEEVEFRKLKWLFNYRSRSPPSGCQHLGGDLRPRAGAPGHRPLGLCAEGEGTLLAREHRLASALVGSGAGSGGREEEGFHKEGVKLI